MLFSAIQQEQQSKNIATAVKHNMQQVVLFLNKVLNHKLLKRSSISTVDKIKAARQNLSDVIEKKDYLNLSC